MWLIEFARSFGWLFCVVVCCFVGTYVAAVAVLLLTKDPKRQMGAIAVLDRHPLARLTRRR
jgi:hypothetical protein